MLFKIFDSYVVFDKQELKYRNDKMQNIYYVTRYTFSTTTGNDKQDQNVHMSYSTVFNIHTRVLNLYTNLWVIEKD